MKIKLTVLVLIFCNVSSLFFSEIIESDYSIEKKGIELVNLNGVAFSHFGKLFNSDDSNSRLNCRCAIMTDDDRSEDEDISSRAARAKKLENGQLRVFLAEKTFEIELFKAGNNKDLLLKVFEEMGCKSRPLVKMT